MDVNLCSVLDFGGFFICLMREAFMIQMMPSKKGGFSGTTHSHNDLRSAGNDAGKMKDIAIRHFG